MKLPTVRGAHASQGNGAITRPAGSKFTSVADIVSEGGAVVLNGRRRRGAQLDRRLEPATAPIRKS